MQQLYNIALVPTAAQFARSLVKQAQENFLEYQDSYILGDSALPHITLCHLFANNKEIDLVWGLIDREFSSEYSVAFDGVYLNSGSNEDEGYIWAGLSLRRDPEIISLQAKIHTRLSAYNYQPLTATQEAYFPHLTFARLQTIGSLIYPDKNFFKKSYSFKGSLGVSDKIGAYKKIIFVKGSET